MRVSTDAKNKPVRSDKIKMCNELRNSQLMVSVRITLREEVVGLSENMCLMIVPEQKQDLPLVQFRVMILNKLLHLKPQYVTISSKQDQYPPETPALAPPARPGTRTPQ